ncbi:MAG: iron ABC transporter permease [Gemmatimonadetes bacterium]|nr:iron ABC transporter permease [Gemmatimonadota bacterium]
MKRRTGLILVGFLLWIVVYPIAIVILESFRDAEGWTVTPLIGFVREPSEWSALWNSVWISLASVVSAAVVGIPLAFVFEKLEFPGRRILGALVALPAVLPPLVGVIAFLFLYGESGFVARIITEVLDLDESPWRLRGAGAILLVHSYSMYVYFYLFTRAGLAKIDSSMTEAAQSLGSPGFSIFRRVTLPLLKPQLGAAALLAFMTSLGSFSAPYIFGGGFRVMTTRIVTSKLNGDMPAALIEATWLAAVALLGLVMFRRFSGSRSVAVMSKGMAARAATIRQPMARWGATTIGWLFAAFLLLPHITLVLVSFVPLNGWSTEILPSSYTIANYITLLHEPERLRPLWNSIWMAGVSTILVLTLSLWAAREIVQRKVRLRGTIESLLNVPWAVPGTVLAVALATMFSVSAPWVGRWVLVGTVVILPLAYFVRNIPVACGAVVAGLRQIDPSLSEAAASLGASKMRTLWRVTVPLIRPALLAGGALAFVTAAGDFVTSVVLYTFETRPVSIEILGALRAYDLGMAAAYGVVLMFVSAAAMVVGTRR